MPALIGRMLGIAAIGALVLAASCAPQRPLDGAGPEEVITPAPDPQDRDAIKTSVSVLIDLSRTWHNTKDKARNKDVLDSVFSAVATAADDVQPMSFRVHPIGEASLNRPVYCSVTYAFNFFGGGGPRDPNTLKDRKKLLAYLTGETGCTDQILRLKPEGRTEITSAIVTAVRSNELRPALSRQILVILSDLQEDPISDYNLDLLNLKSVQILILYRALSDDQIVQSLLDKRVEEWKQKLRARGAKVQAAMDTAAAAGGGDIARILRNGVIEN